MFHKISHNIYLTKKSKTKNEVSTRRVTWKRDWEKVLFQFL